MYSTFGLGCKIAFRVAILRTWFGLGCRLKDGSRRGKSDHRKTDCEDCDYDHRENQDHLLRRSEYCYRSSSCSLFIRLVNTNPTRGSGYCQPSSCSHRHQHRHYLTQGHHQLPWNQHHSSNRRRNIGFQLLSPKL